MTSFLSSFAERHFAERPRQPLLAALATRIDATNLIQALNCGCRPMQHLAWRRMAELPELQLVSLVEQSLKGDVVSPAVLRALGHESFPMPDAILARVVSLMESPLTDVRLAAATVVALRQPDAALPLLKRGNPIDREILRQLCLADDPALVMPLMSAFGFPLAVPPPTIGFVVQPAWLGDAHTREPLLVEWLIRHCGYCDEDFTPEALNLLSSGFSYVTARMTSEPRMTKIAHRWQRRIRAFVWRLLPDELGLLRDDTKPFDVSDPLDTDLFLAAVRDSDRMLFLEQKSLPPFDRARAVREPAPGCFHASSRYVRRLFLDEPLTWAGRWNIPHDRRGDFVIEQARVLLEPNDEARIAADRALRGRWLSRTSRSPLAPREERRMALDGTTRTAFLSRSERATDRTPRGIVIGDFEPPAPDERLSPGANSVVALAAACGLDGRVIANWLAEAESRWSRCLVPIGIEVQIPRVDSDRFAAWKEALPFLGVPSPNRPEFGGMVEAAFRPSKSFHAMVLGPLLLCRLGVIAEPQDLALHISLHGELGDGVRSLAFPQLFIHPSQRLRNRPDWSMARVMSKGFVHVHNDAEIIDHDLLKTGAGISIEADAASVGSDAGSIRHKGTLIETPVLNPSNVTTLRTELRLFRMFAETQENLVEHAHSIELSRSFVSDVMAVQLLGSALASDCRQCRALFGEYADAVERVVCELPSEFHRLLSSNYFESTGDPHDEALLALLPIFRCWSSVRQIVRTRDLAASLDLQFRTLRHGHVQHLLRHWAQDHDLPAPEITFTDDELELALPPSVA